MHSSHAIESCRTHSSESCSSARGVYKEAPAYYTGSDTTGPEAVHQIRVHLLIQSTAQQNRKYFEAAAYPSTTVARHGEHTPASPQPSTTHGLLAKRSVCSNSGRALYNAGLAEDSIHRLHPYRAEAHYHVGCYTAYKKAAALNRVEAMYHALTKLYTVC